MPASSGHCGQSVGNPTRCSAIGGQKRQVSDMRGQNSDKQTALEARGAQVRILAGPVSPGKVHPKVDLAAMMRDLAKREINELHVEAGEKLNGSLVSEGLVDEFLLYYAPRLHWSRLGHGWFWPLARLKDAIRLEFQSIDRCGLDLGVLARVAGRDRF